MEKTQFVEDLDLHQEVHSLFQIIKLELKKTRHGDQYIAMTVGDRTGKIPLRIWSANEEFYRSFAVGELVSIEGIKVTDYQGRLQLSINDHQHQMINSYPLEQFDPADFLEVTDRDPEVLIKGIRDAIGKIEDQGLKLLLYMFFEKDRSFISGFKQSPAAVTHHHAYCGGLLEHTFSVLKFCQQAAENYQVDLDLLTTGAILHDIGKIKSYSFQPVIEMTTEGRLYGHIILGIRMIEEKMDELKKRGKNLISPETTLRINHMIISHHGRKEWGSPVEPSTVEAIILHHADQLDAQAQKYNTTLNQYDGYEQGEWTEYQRLIGRPLFLGLDGAN